MPEHQSASVRNFVSSLLQATRYVVVLAVCLGLFYFLWFRLVNDFSLSTEPAAWGQFGDYFGGILNPLVALFALVLLGRGVRIQQETLEATKTELAAMKEAASQDLILSQFTMLTNLLSQTRQQGLAQSALGAANEYFENPGNPSFGFRQLRALQLQHEALLRPYVSTLMAAADLLQGAHLPVAEMSRYVTVLRGFVSTDEALLISLWEKLGRLSKDDAILAKSLRLFDNAMPGSLESFERRWSGYQIARANYGEIADGKWVAVSQSP